MDSTLKNALHALLLAMADDEMLLGHRDGEWTGHAPILEEDIAFASISQDELGHALMWYMLLENLDGVSPDQRAFFRAPADWRHASLVELPKGDWAFTIVRQYLFDAMEQVRYLALSESSYQPIADVALKVRIEEIYHLRHNENWVRRLGDATDESHRRMQAALDACWPHALGLFEPTAGEDILVAEKVKPAESVLQKRWLDMVEPVLTKSSLTIPDSSAQLGGRQGHHTAHLEPLITEMQKVARALPDVTW